MTERSARVVAALPGLLLLGLLLLPVAGLLAATAPGELLALARDPEALGSLRLSLATTAISLPLAVLLGTPLAWRLSRRPRLPRPVALALELPVVLPPTVLGLALLETWGRQGLVGRHLPLALPFGTGGVVLVQLLVAAPLYVLAATNAFRAVDDDLVLVARTLGAGPLAAWATVALPTAAAGLAGGAAMAWARALGEFGATLVFAGSLPGRTRTLPLAIVQAMERDLALARSLAVLLLAVALAVLLVLRSGRREAAP